MYYPTWLQYFTTYGQSFIFTVKFIVTIFLVYYSLWSIGRLYKFYLLRKIIRFLDKEYDRFKEGSLIGILRFSILLIILKSNSFMSASDISRVKALYPSQSGLELNVMSSTGMLREKYDKIFDGKYSSIEDFFEKELINEPEKIALFKHLPNNFISSFGFLVSLSSKELRLLGWAYKDLKTLEDSQINWDEDKLPKRLVQFVNYAHNNYDTQ